MYQFCNTQFSTLSESYIISILSDCPRILQKISFTSFAKHEVSLYTVLSETTSENITFDSLADAQKIRQVKSYVF